MAKWFNKSSESASSKIGQRQVSRLLEIASELHSSLYLFSCEDVWRNVTKQIRDFYNCELATLFLVDNEAPGFLTLEAQYPWSTEHGALRLRIASEKGAGLTGHVAHQGDTLMFNKNDLDNNEFIKNRNPPYLNGRCYSALFAPLKNRKGRLIGLVRLNNKKPFAIQSSEFSEDDRITMNFLAVQIVALLENAQAFEAMRNLIEEVQKAGSTESAVQCILSRAIRLLNADYAKLALWSRQTNKLVFAGAMNINDGDLPQKGDPIESGNIMNAIWRSARTEESVKENSEVWIDFGSSTSECFRCALKAKSSISIVLRVHNQPVGVLHLESIEAGWFDDLDRQVLKALVRNVSIAVQSMSQPWPVPEEGDDFDEEILSLGESEGFFHSLVRHIPLVMWRKDMNHEFIWVNDQFCKTVGKKRSEVIGKTDFELFPGDKARRFLVGDEEAIKNGVFEDTDEPYELAGGKTRFIHVIKKPFHDLFGNVAGTQGIFLDVTGDRFRQLFKLAPVGFHELNDKGEILHINDAERQMLGYDSDEVIACESYWDFSSKDENDRKVMKTLVEDQLKRRKTEGEWQPVNLQKQDGVTIPVLINSSRVSDANNNTTGLLCVVREISAGIDIEEALRDPDSRYLARIRELSIPVFRVDGELRFTFGNRAYLDYENFDNVDDIRGKTSAEIYSDLGVQYDLDNKQVLESGEVLDRVELHKDRKTGEDVLVRVLKFPIRDSEGHLIGLQGVFWNYENQEDAKAGLSDALDEAKEEYREIVRKASEGIFQATLEGRFIGANPAMFTLLGCKSEEELLDWDNAGVKRFSDALYGAKYFNKLKVLGVGKSLTFEYLLFRKDYVTTWVSETVQKVADHNGCERLVGFVEDISERRRNAEAKERMLTMLAHQLRSPVWQAHVRANQMIKHSDPGGLLGEGKASPTVLQMATVRGLTRKTRAVAWSIDMMSKLAHKEKVEIPKKSGIHPRRLIKMVREAARDVQIIQRVSKSFLARLGQSIEVPDYCVIPKEKLASDFKIIGDPDLIEQCVGNLIENAFKYSVPSSNIEIGVLLEFGSATVTVKNKPLVGLEVDAETRVKCREKEWRSPVAKSMDADGTGLGLWFADRIMLAHSGELRVSEIDNEGWNTFSLYFKL